MRLRNNGTLMPQELTSVNLGDVNTAWAKAKRELEKLTPDQERSGEEPALMLRPYGSKCDKCNGDLTLKIRRLKDSGMFAAYEGQVVCTACQIQKRRYRVVFNDLQNLVHQVEK